MRKSVLDVMLRRARRGGLGARRLAAWAARPGEFVAEPFVGSDDFPHEHLTLALPIGQRGGDPRLEEGKRVNLALAAPAFDGRRLDPARPFSFWRALGPLRRADGWRDGVELRAGCVVPALGGGLCLISNAIFRLAARMGWTIVERHGHSLEAVPPPPGELWGMDATIAFPHVDLRVRPRSPVRLSVRVDGEHLRVAAHGAAPPSVKVSLAAEDDRVEGAVRRNRIRRWLRDARGRVLDDRVIAVNEKRLLRARSCVDCDEMTCADRPAWLR